MRRAPGTSKHHTDTGRTEFALIVAAIVLATVATYFALSKKLAALFVEFAAFMGWMS